jgi:hypothetical protein
LRFKLSPWWSEEKQKLEYRNPKFETNLNQSKQARSDLEICLLP